MRNLIALVIASFFVLCSTTTMAQLNTKPIEEKGFVVKQKFKPYKKTKDYVLKLKLKNSNLKPTEIGFQLYLYIDGKAEIMSEQKNTCLRPNKKVKYRFLFENLAEGTRTIEFEKLAVNEVESCIAAE